jgi:beta-barrel assembly-enhancing protease
MTFLKQLVALTLLLCFLPLTSFGLTLEEERKYGREVYLEMARSSRFYDDPFLSLYLAKIKERLEAATSLPYPVKLTIVEARAPNAFAMIGGYVYMTTGLLEMSDSEEEVAGVLAHELGHLSRRHIAKRADQDKFLSAGMIAALLAGMLLKSPALMTTGLASAQTVALKHSREDEDEADRVGLATAERAGYSGRGIAEFLKKMRQAGLEKLLPQYLLTHPYSEERMKNINALSTLRQTTVDVSLFPVLVERLRIMRNLFTPMVEETVLKRYAKDPTNIVNAYSACLVFSMEGRTDKALEVVRTINSPYRTLFTAEILIKGQRFQDAIDTLGGQPRPLERLLLAKAYEQSGALAQSAEVLNGLVPEAKYYPEIYQRLGMALGRQGNQAGGYAYLGRYYYEVGREDAAKVNLEKAVAKYGMNSPESKELLDLLTQMKKQKDNKTPKQDEPQPSIFHDELYSGGADRLLHKQSSGPITPGLRDHQLSALQDGLPE